MKKLAAILLVLALVLALAACGEPDPNLGTYKGTTVEMEGFTLPITEAWEKGFDIELKSGGWATLTIDGEDINVKWALNGETITITASDGEFTGTLIDGTIVLKNLLDRGMDATFVKEG